MIDIARFVPEVELQKHEGKFTSTSFNNVLKELEVDKMGEPVASDIVIKTIQPNETDLAKNVIETNKLLSFGKKFQLLLTLYEVTTDKETINHEVVQVWQDNHGKAIFKEYLNGILSVETFVDEIHDVYKDFQKVPEVPEANEDLLVEVMYDPLSCIRNGSCCYFENQRYEHCGKYCGIYEANGGGTSINAIDRCCLTHDIQIRGKTGRDRCTPHQNFLNCTENLSGPGYNTIRNGIRLDAVAALCFI